MRKRSSKIHFYIFAEGDGNPSFCDCKNVFTTKKEKEINCMRCLGLLIARSKGDRKRRLQRQLKDL